MSQRYVSIWFRYLKTDWFSLRQPNLHTVPFVLRTSSHGRMIITAANCVAESKGIFPQMVLADARAIQPDLHVLDDKPEIVERLLTKLAEWCIRFTPSVGIDPPDGLILDATGCTHLWGGDEKYLKDIIQKLNGRGYHVRVSIADTIGTAWGMARYGDEPLLVNKGCHVEALNNLPPEALRVDPDVAEKFHKLGLHRVSQFATVPRTSLRRRFGVHFLRQMDRALGYEIESIVPVKPVEPYQERLACLEPIVTAPGIEEALKKLLESLCLRLRNDQKGLRSAVFRGYRVDGKVEQISIGTHRPSHHVNHLFRLFELSISSLEPSLGIEVFSLEATKVDDHLPNQEKVWEESGGHEDERLSELLDRLSGRVGSESVHRYLPDEHYWPERSIKKANSLKEERITNWPSDRLRPIHLLQTPERIDVTAPIPDYPPMLFLYKGKLHKIVKADGPERIEQEWWIQQGQHRDYYRVEDEEGSRYWLFRSGHYHDKTYQWFIHGFFA